VLPVAGCAFRDADRPSRKFIVHSATHFPVIACHGHQAAAAAEQQHVLPCLSRRPVTSAGYLHQICTASDMYRFRYVPLQRAFTSSGFSGIIRCIWGSAGPTCITSPIISTPPPPHPPTFTFTHSIHTHSTCLSTHRDVCNCLVAAQYA